MRIPLDRNEVYFFVFLPELCLLLCSSFCLTKAYIIHLFELFPYFLYNVTFVWCMYIIGGAFYQILCLNNNNIHDKLDISF